MATKYFIGSGANWDDDANWSTTSGGSNDTTKPTAADEARLDSNSGDCTINANVPCRSLDCNGYTGTLNHSSNTLSLGDGTEPTGGILLRLSSGMTYTKGGLILIKNNTSTQRSLYFNGQDIQDLTLEGFGTTSPNILIADDFNCREIDLQGGEIDFGGNTGTMRNLKTSGGNAKTLTLQDSNITATGTGFSFNNTSGSALSVTTNTATITLTGSGATFNMSGKSFGGILNMSGGGGQAVRAGSLGTLNLSNGNISLQSTMSIETLNYTSPSTARIITFNSGTTYTITTFNVSGLESKLISLRATSDGSQATISKSSGIVSVSYLDIKDCNATGGADWQAYTSNGNVDSGNNTGWVFTEPVLGSYEDDFWLLSALRKRRK